MTVEVECPQCGTVFALDVDALKPGDPRVRCGECHAIFAVDPDGATSDDDGAYAETGVGWVIVASRDGSEDVDDEPGARYVAANERDAWKALGTADGAAASNSSADEEIEELRNAETLVHQPAPVSLVLVDEAGAGETADAAETPGATQAPSGDASTDWQALLEEIDTLPEADEQTEPSAGDDATTDADAADGDPTGAVEPPTEDAPDNADLVADADAAADDDESADDASGSDADKVDEADDQDVVEITLGTDNDDSDPLLDTGIADLAADAEVDALELITDGADEDASVAAEPAPDNDEPADAMSGFTVSESDFKPADDAFVEAVIDNFVFESETAAPKADTASNQTGDSSEISPETDPTPGATDNSDNDDGDVIGDNDDGEALDVSGIFVRETLLPEHGDSVAPEDALHEAPPAPDIAGPDIAAAVPAAKDTDSDRMFETAIGLAPDVSEPTFMSRHGAKLAAALALLLILQPLHRNRAELATVGKLNPLYEAIYGARLQPAWDVGALCFEQRDASAADGRMNIAAQVRNRSAQPLPYPMLHITLSDRFDNGAGQSAIAHRLVPAAQYLTGGTPGGRIAPGEAFQLTTTLADPGPDIGGYELEVCFHRQDGQLACNNGC